MKQSIKVTKNDLKNYIVFILFYFILNVLDLIKIKINLSISIINMKEMQSNLI